MRPHWYRFMLLFLVTALCCLQTAVAANGKIRGVIKSADGEAVVSANVLIEGTTMGAAADANGQYFILNVPPGSYRVRASAVGYTPQVFTDVLVRSDQIVTLDFTLRSEAFAEGERMPARFSRRGGNASPPLAWTEPPSGDAEPRARRRRYRYPAAAAGHALDRLQHLSRRGPSPGGETVRRGPRRRHHAGSQLGPPQRLYRP